MLKILKKNLITIFFCLFTIFLICFSEQNLIACKKGLTLWATCVVPSLFPFFIATELLNHTKIPLIIGKLFEKIMRPIFNVPGESAYALIMGLICGYPTGAKIVSSFYENNICTKEEAERMLSFTNNSGPLFIISTLGGSFYGNTEIGFLLLFTHILASLTSGIFLGIYSRLRIYTSQNYNNKYINFKIKKINFPLCSKQAHSSKSIYTNNRFIKNTDSTVCNFSNIGEILGNSINSSISTIFIIGGYIALFSVIISIINSLNLYSNLANIFNLPTTYLKGFTTGLLEITNGLNVISSIATKKISINIVISSFILGFGGLCVFLQIYSVISKQKLSVKYYIFGKLLQGLFSILYTFLILNFCPLFFYDL